MNAQRTRTIGIQLRAWSIGAAFAIPCLLQAQEICDNAIDDDGDGLIDLNDSLDCVCGGILVVDTTVASLVPNPSFEQYDQLPNFLSQLDRCSEWSQATEGTSDYYYDPSFNMVNAPFPPPDGHGYVGIIASTGPFGLGDHDEYLGCNLSAPLQAGTPYTLRAYIAGGGIVDTMPYAFIPPWTGPIDITVFGFADEAQFPIYGSACPAPLGWVALGHASYQAEPTWSVITISFTPPVDMAAIMIGAPCDRPADHVHTAERSAYPYYLFDKLVLNTSELFSGVVVPQGGLCANNLQLTAHAAVDPVGHQWYFNGVALLGQTGPVLHVSALGLGLGNYTCVAYDVNNDCTAMDHAVIASPEPSIVVTATPRLGCMPLEVDFVCTSAVQDIHWDFGDGTTGQGASVTHLFQQDGTYDITVGFTTLQGCAYDTTFNDLITVWPKPEIGIVVDPVGPYDPDDAVLLQGEGVHADRWTWAFNGQAPYIVIDTIRTAWTLPSAPGVYPVTLYAINSFGCLDTAQVQLVVLGCDEGSVFVPSAFSPDGSGKNDRLCVYGPCIAHLAFRLFDRWGNKVYESFDPTQCWEGQHNGQPLDAGVFVYQLHATLKDGRTLERQGNITLIR
ncbi:MAG TPA: PKD domain-containing protein [Flavobacteriales bacterium]